MAKKLVICSRFFEPGFKGGGPITSTKNFIDFNKGSYDITVLTTDRDLGDNAPYPGIEVKQVLQKDGYQVIYIKESDILGLISLIRSFSKDSIFIVNSFFNLFSLSCALISSWVGYSLLLAPRGVLKQALLRKGRFKKRIFIAFFRMFLSKDVCFQATYTDERDEIGRLFPKNRIEILPNYIAAPRRYDDFEIDRLLYFGRLADEKNILFLIKAVSETNWKLDLIGPFSSGDYESQCRNLVTELDVSDQVKFLEPMNPQQLKEQVPKYKYFVSPTKSENFGHSIYESLAASLPIVIGSNTPWMVSEGDHFGYVLGYEESEWIDVLNRIESISKKDYLSMKHGAFLKAKAAFDAQQKFSVDLSGKL